MLESFRTLALDQPSPIDDLSLWAATFSSYCRVGLVEGLQVRYDQIRTAQNVAIIQIPVIGQTTPSLDLEAGIQRMLLCFPVQVGLYSRLTGIIFSICRRRV